MSDMMREVAVHGRLSAEQAHRRMPVRAHPADIVAADMMRCVTVTGRPSADLARPPRPRVWMAVPVSRG